MFHDIVNGIEAAHAFEGNGNGLVSIGDPQVFIQPQKVLYPIEQVHDKPVFVDPQTLTEGAEDFSVRFIVDVSAELEICSRHCVAHYKKSLLADVNVGRGGKVLYSIEDIAIHKALNMSNRPRRDIGQCPQTFFYKIVICLVHQIS